MTIYVDALYLDTPPGFNGIPVGAIVTGQFAADPTFLPLDGSDQLKASYPLLDYTGMETFGANKLATRTLPGSYYWCAVDFGGGSHIAVNRSSNTVAAKSTDGGASWAPKTVPAGIYYCIKYFPTLNGGNGMWIAAGAGVCATSTDNGDTWTSRAMAGTIGSLEMIAGLVVGLPAGLQTNTDSASYYTTPDGLTWTSRTMPAAAAYGPAKVCGNRLIAPVYKSSESAYPYSFSTLDGINWITVYQPSTGPVFTTTVEEFKGRTFWQTNLGLAVTQLDAQAGSAYTNILRPGLSWAGSGLFGALTANYSKVGPWLAELATNSMLNITNDGQLWRTITPLSGMAGSPTSSGQMAFGNNSLVILNGVDGSSSIFTLAVDISKFRVPKARVESDADRLYIKAK